MKRQDNRYTHHLNHTNTGNSSPRIYIKNTTPQHNVEPILKPGSYSPKRYMSTTQPQYSCIYNQAKINDNSSQGSASENDKNLYSKHNLSFLPKPSTLQRQSATNSTLKERHSNNENHNQSNNSSIMSVKTQNSPLHLGMRRNNTFST